MYTWIFRFSLIGMILIGSMAGVRDGLAQDATPGEAPPPQFGIAPVGDYPKGYFEIELAAGTSTTLTVQTLNLGEGTVSLRTFATNAFNPPNGGFAAADEETELVGTALWVDFTATSFELEPGEKQEQAFTVTVPEGTAPGQHVAALVVRTEGDMPMPGSEVFRQVLRSAIPLVINVPGAIEPGFTLGDPAFSIETAVTTLEIPMTNTGNTRVRPQGELTVTTPDGNVVLSSRVEMGSVYGGNETIIQVGIPDQVLPGDYAVSVEISDEETGAQDAFADVLVTLPERPERVRATPVPVEQPVFEVTGVSISPDGTPVQYADVAATIVNNGSNIPTANVMLHVHRDGEVVESYPLAENRALPRGETALSQRYIPVDGWEPGEYTFELVISAVSGETETTLSSIDVEETITVP